MLFEVVVAVAVVFAVAFLFPVRVAVGALIGSVRVGVFVRVSFPVGAQTPLTHTHHLNTTDRPLRLTHHPRTTHAPLMQVHTTRRYHNLIVLLLNTYLITIFLNNTSVVRT